MERYNFSWLRQIQKLTQRNIRIFLFNFREKILKILITKLQLGKINFLFLSQKEEELADLINEKRIEFIR